MGALLSGGSSHSRLMLREVVFNDLTFWGCSGRSEVRRSLIDLLCNHWCLWNAVFSYSWATKKIHSTLQAHYATTTYSMHRLSVPTLYEHSYWLTWYCLKVRAWHNAGIFSWITCCWPTCMHDSVCTKISNNRFPYPSGEWTQTSDEISWIQDA